MQRQLGKDLTAAEKSKLMVEYVEAAEKAAKEEKRVSSDNRTKLSARGRENEGRPQKPGSVREVEQRTGIKRDAQQRAKQHVNAFTRYPFLERPHWNQAAALEAFRALEALPAQDRDRAAAMIDQTSRAPLGFLGRGLAA